jgi:hypothetical protein
MRFLCVIAFLLAFGGLAVAQQPETNFAVGPQYLITQPYPTILQPIATPTDEPWQPTGVVSPQTGEAGPVMITVPAYLPSIYWGYPPPGEVEVVPEPEPEQVPNNLPPGYIDTGVSAVATPTWLKDHDYGMSLAQVARYWRAQHLHATHVYTNKDIDQLNGE